MNRLALLTAILTISLIVSSCSAPFIGAVNVTLGGEAESALLPAAEETEPTPECPAYHPIPKSVKEFLAAKNDTDPAIDPWAGWMLTVRSWLEGGC